MEGAGEQRFELLAVVHRYTLHRLDVSGEEGFGAALRVGRSRPLEASIADLLAGRDLQERPGA